jgi:FkbM family methyltransferase
MAIQGKEQLAEAQETSDLRLTSPFKTPISEMGRIGWGLYRLKWAVGFRLIGPSAWTRKLRKRLSYGRWVIAHVKGWSGFLIWRLGIRIPFRASVGDQHFHVGNSTDREKFSAHVRGAYDPSPFEEDVLGERKGVFHFKFEGKSLEFPYDGNRYGTMVVLREFFVNEPYAGLDVEGMDVIDIGSSIGDTPIYFALKGARKVISFEPYPDTYSQARHNISANGFDDRVTLLNEGAGVSGWMKLARSPQNLWANAVPSSDGQEVRFNSMKDIISRFKIETAILKFHGEGSEYEFLLNASTDDLAHFPQIALKYHYGAKPILRKLRSAGFTIVRKWDLHFSYNSSSSSPKYEAGMILAKRMGRTPN